MPPWSRRRFLRLLAAGSAWPLAAACRPPPRTFSLPGRIVNPAPLAGHLLRRTYTREDFPAPRGSPADVVVVGGGISGLCAAWKLRKSGVDAVSLLELGEELGGTSIAGRGKHTAFPWGAHYINIPPAEADCVHELLGDLGVIEGYDARGWPRIAPEYLLRWPHERLFIGERWVEGRNSFAGAPAGEVEVLRAFEDEMLRWTLYRGRDGRRAFTLPLRYSSADEELRALDAMSMETYLRQKGWNSRRLDWLVDYACRDDYGSLSRQVSAWAGIHYFACRFYDYRVADEYPADILTWPEGNAFLARGLAAGLEGNFELRQLVLRVEAEEQGVRLGCMDLASGERYSLRSRGVVYAAKLHTAPFVVAGLPAPQQRALRALQYSPWLVAVLQVRRLPERTSAAAWDNILFESPSLGYVVADHQRRRPQAGAPSAMVYYLPFVEDVGAARRQLLGRDHSYWVNLIMNDLLRPHPDLEDLVERIDIYRWGHAMVRPAPGVLWGAQSRRRTIPLGGVFFATCEATGMPLFEEACFAGIRAAEQCMEHIGMEFQTSLRGLVHG